MALCTTVGALTPALTQEEDYTTMDSSSEALVLALNRRHKRASCHSRRNGHRRPIVITTGAIERRSYDNLSWNYLPVTLSSDETRLVEECVKYVLPHVRPKWTASAEKPPKHKIFEDGVSNTLIGLFRDRDGDVTETEEDDDAPVLVRVNGEGRELLIDGETEIAIKLTLHEAGLSPPLYLVTENAMCYGYVPGRALTSSEMQCEEVLRATARTLASFHSVKPPSRLRGDEPWVWRQMEKWMGLVEDCFSDLIQVTTLQRFQEVFGTMEELKKEKKWLWSLLTGELSLRNINNKEDEGDSLQLMHPSSSCCVLCHNDPQPLNFVRTPTGGVVLIDMEYSGLNYRAFDIGTFFCEFAGVHGTLDYGARYPDEGVQKKWISYYLRDYAELNNLDSNLVTSIAQIKQVYRDANHFALVAHFLWSLWSLIQVKYSKLQFDYFEYGCSRYREYKRRKAVILSTFHTNQ